MIASSDYRAYVTALDAQYAEAATLMKRYIASFDWNADYPTVKAQRDLVADYMKSLVDVYGTNTAVLAADFYKLVADSDGVTVDEPLIADTVADKTVQGSVRYAAKSLWGDTPDPESFSMQVVASLIRYVKKGANDTMAINARRDGRKNKGVRWARVPRGAETCPFCIMLASRGFVYWSKESADLFGHEHEHCDCDIIPSFSDAGLEGYDQGEYEQVYLDNLVKDRYGTVQTAETLDNMRRKMMEDDSYRERVNAQRRAWYARNAAKERERVAKYRERKNGEA